MTFRAKDFGIFLAQYAEMANGRICRVLGVFLLKKSRDMFCTYGIADRADCFGGLEAHNRTEFLLSWGPKIAILFLAWTGAGLHGSITNT